MHHKTPNHPPEPSELDRLYLWHPFTHMADWTTRDQLVIERGQGEFLIDTQGRRYLDGVSSLWCNIHGHRVPQIDQAIRDQLDKIAHTTLLGLASPPSAALAHRLVEITPASLTKVFYSDNGSTAVEVAAKLAFQYWQNKGQPRRSFLTLRNGYHGDTVGSVSLGGIDLFHQTFGPLLFKTHFAPSPYCYRCELGLEPKTCDLACAAEVDRILTDHPSQIAAVFVEPLVQGAGGIIVAPDGYLREIRRITSKHNVLFVADEVAVGFGRTGKMFACQHENVQPDFLCLAKGITAGYLPLAATLVSREIFDVFNATTFYHGHTYTGNALACAAALANLDIFDQQEVLESLQPKINLFAQRLEELIGLPFVGDIRSKGLMAGIELVADPPTKLPFACDRHIGAQVCLATRNHGVVLRSLADVIVLMPPLSIATENIDLLFDALTKALRDSADLMQSAAREASENA